MSVCLDPRVLQPSLPNSLRPQGYMKSQMHNIPFKQVMTMQPQTSAFNSVAVHVSYL